ncbi:hypothetical protein GM418_16670 [Maribellus comscasis]|uniref:Uncharacterized protein n=1 Tax=Maribellus comscasis TaxID=2681766 RepID=A0A6I6K5H0_9BACT|nr:DUF6029 family protein [Maribellus comscasis]QGY45244.1 hypothetical protein GM418_16670 [Maribellus comscasis]
MKNKHTTLLLAFCCGVISLKAQLTGNNLAEYQIGNIPGTDPQYVNSVYDQLNLDYRFKEFRVSARLENYYSGDSLRIAYTKITQYALNYRSKGINLKAGHFYETLGKGILFRGYEIKNSIYEDQIYRVKQGFYRDAVGFSGSYSNKLMHVKALRGKSLINQLPPTAHDRRLDLVTAVETKFKIANQAIGIIGLQNETKEKKSKYLSALISGNLLRFFDYYGELAHRINAGENFFSFENSDSYGAYFSLGFSKPGLGASLELKDYRNIFIGSGISDPPTLVKEHFYKLLNRSTHVPYYFDESGYQFELFFVPAENHLITVNHSHSKNDLGDKDYDSGEYFADWQFTFRSKNQVKIFIDYSYDDILFENARYATGFYFTHILAGDWSGTVESEIQQIERTITETQSFINLYTGFILNKSSRFSAAFVLEFTNDEKVADVANTKEIETHQFYPGLNFSLKPNRKNTLQLFVGKRRGGPTCTSGICYEVLDFKGAELRWMLRI